MKEPVARAQPPPAARLWRWRPNPLRRRVDLLEAWIGLILVVVAVAATPATALLVGTAVHHSLHRDAREQASRHQRTTAVVLQQVPQHPEPGSDEALHTRYPAEVRFTGPGGRPRTASTDVVPGLPAGSRVTVWTDASGRLTDPPPTSDEILSRAVGWGSVAGAAVVLTCAVGYLTVSRLMDRRRIAQWARAWLRTAPRWTTRA